MRIEEFSPMVACVKGDNNNIADTMSWILQRKENLTLEEVFSLIEEYYTTTRKDVKQQQFQKCPVGIEVIYVRQLEDLKFLKTS